MSGYSESSTATFSCDEGYSLNGSEILHCGSDGQWSQDQPTCEGRKEHLAPWTQSIVVVTWNNHQDKNRFVARKRSILCLSDPQLKNHFLCNNRYHFPSFVTVPEVFPTKRLSRNRIIFKWQVNCNRAWRSSLLFFTFCLRYILVQSDEDECFNSTVYCDLNATCTNMEGSFECVCEDGFTGDGSTCTLLGKVLKWMLEADSEHRQLQVLQTLGLDFSKKSYIRWYLSRPEDWLTLHSA